MKVSQEQKAQNRGRILTEAGRLFREKGFDAVSVAEVMKAAGMTMAASTGIFSRRTIWSPRPSLVPSAANQ
ncbi:DNA-binding transcriptional regulator YbjK [Rhizobium mesoamericanum]|nr:DNA-binding transcriptional regulator YbjK [Rhizobium mesoamericanum]